MSFVQNFNKRYPRFLKNLLGEFPNLTQRELLMCMYIKLNYSNHEISELMNISKTSVDSYRHRARKKMKLKRSDSLISHLNKF
jgi:DNA-binding CsgD family transcriptional regulator